METNDSYPDYTMNTFMGMWWVSEKEVQMWQNMIDELLELRDWYFVAVINNTEVFINTN